MARYAEIVAAVFLAAAGGSGGRHESLPPFRWADARYPLRVTVHETRLDSGTSCSSVLSPLPLPSIVTRLKAGLRCGPEGGRQVDVTYTFVGRVPAGDRYRLTRTVPFGGNNPQVTTADVVFAGTGRQVVFAAADHVVTVEPPDFQP